MKSTPRKPLGKKLRFDVFKRDHFACQYCGKTPPSVTLEIDHIIPVAKSGTNDIDNLITACFECNRGKRDIALTTLPASTVAKSELLQEKELQYKEYQKILKAIERRIQKECSEVEDEYIARFPEYHLADHFLDGSVRKFIEALGLSQVKSAMRTACIKVNHKEQAIRYFCGICWGKIREAQ